MNCEYCGTWTDEPKCSQCGAPVPKKKPRREIATFYGYPLDNMPDDIRAIWESGEWVGRGRLSFYGTAGGPRSAR